MCFDKLSRHDFEISVFMPSAKSVPLLNSLFSTVSTQKGARRIFRNARVHARDERRAAPGFTPGFVRHFRGEKNAVDRAQRRACEIALARHADDAVCSDFGFDFADAIASR